MGVLRGLLTPPVVYFTLQGLGHAEHGVGLACRPHLRLQGREGQAGGAAGQVRHELYQAGTQLNKGCWGCTGAALCFEVQHPSWAHTPKLARPY